MGDETRPLRPDDDPEGSGAADPSHDARTRRIDGEEPPSSGDGGGWKDFGGRNVPVAIGTGVVLAVVVLGTLWWGAAPFTALVVVIAVVGVVESGRVLRDAGVPVAVPVVVVATLVMLVGAYRAGTAGQVVGLAVLFVGAIVWELVESERQAVVKEIAATSFHGLWVPFLASYAVLLVTWPVDGWLALLATALVAIVSDIGAFVVGTRYGRRKLAPSVSPAKSWEGVLGGLALATVVSVALFPWLGTGELFSPLSAIVFAVVVAISGVVGDLAESMVKRDIGVKDLGGVIPGHGGVLDRIDSVLFALPTAYYVLALIH